MGFAAMSGRAAGYCAGYGIPGYASPASGRGFGMGGGRGRGAWCRGFGGGGRGWRHWFNATGLPGWMRYGGYAAPYGYTVPFQKPEPELERQALKNEADALRAELAAIERRLSEIKTGAAAQGDAEG